MRLQRPALNRPALALLTALTLGGSSAPALAHYTGEVPSGTTPVKRVQADNFRFCKYSAPGCTSEDTGHRTRVVVGTRVKWIYKDTECDAIALCPGHNVKVEHRTKSADVKTDGAVIYSMVFKSVGKFSYWCTIHRNQGMTGKVVVRSG